MRTFFYLLLMILAFSCNSKPSVNKTTAEVKNDPQVQIRNFPAENHLFLNFYAGMSREEVKEILKKHIGKSDIYKLKKTSKTPWRVDREHLMELSVSNIDSINFFPGFKHLYYKFSNGSEIYYAFLDFEFASYSSLGKISLLLPDYAPQSETSADRIKKQFEKSKILSSSVHKLYRQKYGNPTIEQGYRSKFKEIYYDVMNAKEIYDGDFHYLEDINRYREGNKLIEITHSINSLQIVYLLYSDHLKKKREREEKLQEQQNKKEDIFQKTMEDI